MSVRRTGIPAEATRGDLGAHPAGADDADLEYEHAQLLAVGCV
jgi:hypothetical protein